MSQNKKWIFVMIIALIVINLWQWWPITKQAGLLGEQQRSGQVHASDLSLSGYAIENKGVRTVRRDLFVMSVPKKEKTITKKLSVTKKPKIKMPKKSAKTFKQYQKRSSLNQFKLVGVLFHNGEKNVYLVKDDKDYAVKRGDKIEGRYLVKEVTVKTITLLESRTRKSSIITMH
ncbi:MAG: hypothetical protein KAU21_17970 [Gammaproteobacteria bacterium]|nr:hypothetical protein [Gammaproteobacteria bacterium]